MPAQQHFSLEEVNALVPKLTRIVGKQLELRAGIERMLDELAEVTGSRGDVTPRASDTPDIRKQKREVARAVDVYQSGWDELEVLGGVLKDPREGLVDFYGKVGERLVWLCWKFGEARIDHYHQLDEGFSARKRIEEAGRRILLN